MGQPYSTSTSSLSNIKPDRWSTPKSYLDREQGPGYRPPLLNTRGQRVNPMLRNPRPVPPIQRAHVPQNNTPTFNNPRLRPPCPMRPLVITVPQNDPPPNPRAMPRSWPHKTVPHPTLLTERPMSPAPKRRRSPPILKYSRFMYTPEELTILDTVFESGAYKSTTVRAELAYKFNVAESYMKGWFRTHRIRLYHKQPKIEGLNLASSKCPSSSSSSSGTSPDERFEDNDADIDSE